MGRTHTSDNTAGLETRGRPRERERRTAGTMKERSRERDFGRTTGRKSRSPTRTKATLIRSSTSTITGSSRNQDVGRRPDQLSRVDRGHDREKSRDRNQLQAASSKLRMDRNRDRERDKDFKTASSDKDAQGNRKRLVELDRVVKRAREERSSYWNKRVLEAEEKDPNRWGHSGFKELYRRDMKLGNHGRSDSPLASASSAKVFRRSSPERQRRLLQPQDSARGIPARGRSHSKSPRSKIKARTGRKSPSSFQQPSSAAPRPLLGTNRRSSPFLDDLSESKRNQDRRRNIDRSNVLSERRSYTDRVATSKSAGSRNLDDKAEYRGWSDKKNNSRIRRKSPSDSLSQSRTRSSMSPPAKMKRSSNLSSSKADPKGKDAWNRTNSMGISNSHSRSRSRSSSSSSSKDEDVLELHAKSRRKGSSISSQSSSSSSDDESKSNSSSSSAESSKRRNGSSSSTSSSESDSDDDSDISGKVEARANPISSRLYNKDAGKPGSKGKPGEESRTGTKRQITGSSAVSSKVPRKSTTTSKEARSNEKPAAGDSESDSGSSSDSDSEPRMTLSERFAKLTQMSTDKREFAKPVLAMNEIDTKLKVVKDLRNADVKIYVDGLQQKNENQSSAKLRPKSPDYNHGDGEKRYNSDDRRRHFERMARDEPRERPADWSDSRVRFEYYRDRGYFNDRPLTFEEYFKWEQWWYEYRDWLETEGYYPRVDNSAPRGNHGQFLGNAEGGSRGSRVGDWNQSSAGISSRMRPGPGQPPPRSNPVNRRVEQVPVRMIPLSSRTHFMGRTDGRGRGPGPAHGGLQGRSIDRVPGGSLIVNIRQGNNYGPRGRHVGLIRGRQR